MAIEVLRELAPGGFTFLLLSFCRPTNPHSDECGVARWGPQNKNKTALKKRSAFIMESIYNLVPVDVEVPVKPPMYRSRHDPKNSDIAGSTIGKP